MPREKGAEKSSADAARRRAATPGRTWPRSRATWAIGPRTELEEGVRRFVDWYLEYYGVPA